MGALGRLARIVFLVVLCLASGPRTAVGEDVDLLLVLAVDVSRSIDDDEFVLQRRGYADAFTNAAVISAIRSTPRHKIAVLFVEWAGADFQRVVVPWTVVSDGESGQLFAEAILREPRSFWGWTSISGAIDFGAKEIERAPHQAKRKVIDVSGDGVNNSGRASGDARDEAVASGITINGLVIMNERPTPGFDYRPQPPLDAFYREHVIGGPGAFLVVAENFNTFAFAIVNKLIREIADNSSATNTAAAPR